MRLLNYLLILTTCVMLISPVSFANTTVEKQAPASMVFQVIQDQLRIDNSAIKNASIIENSDGTYSGLQIELNSSAAKELNRITAVGVGKRANLVINDKIASTSTVRSPLQDKFLITGITENDAQNIIDSLKR